ncbi:MAG: hypothetical protein JNM85_03680 [Chthonomonas sp.]|nr:hypothetical protein [Chthonomonas sp.]
MPYINLIHEQRMLQQQNERKARFAFVGFVGATTLFTVLAGFQIIAKEGVDGETADLKKNLSKIQPMLKDISVMEKDLAELKPRLQTLQNAQEMTRKWTEILKHMTTSTPESLWLTDIRSKSSKSNEGVQFSIKGKTMAGETTDQNSQGRVGSFMQRLQLCSAMDKWDLKYTEMDRVQEHQVLSFEIIARVAGTLEEDPKSKSTKKAGFSDRRKSEAEASA